MYRVVSIEYVRGQYKSFFYATLFIYTQDRFSLTHQIIFFLVLYFLSLIKEGLGVNNMIMINEG